MLEQHDHSYVFGGAQSQNLTREINLFDEEDGNADDGNIEATIVFDSRRTPMTWKNWSRPLISFMICLLCASDIPLKFFCDSRTINS